MDSFSVIVTNFNGEELLKRNLPALVETVKPSAGSREILVADDGSADGSLTLLAGEFPQVRVLAQETNLGFIPNSNAAVAAAEHDIVILLNNDVIVSPDFHLPLLKHFQESQVFAVVPYCETVFEEETINESISYLLPYEDDSFIFIRLTDPDHPLARVSGLVLYASGGFGAFDRRKFLSLGGFDELYAHFIGRTRT